MNLTCPKQDARFSPPDLLCSITHPYHYLVISLQTRLSPFITCLAFLPLPPHSVSQPLYRYDPYSNLCYLILRPEVRKLFSLKSQIANIFGCGDHTVTGSSVQFAVLTGGALVTPIPSSHTLSQLCGEITQNSPLAGAFQKHLEPEDLGPQLCVAGEGCSESEHKSPHPGPQRGGCNHM